MYDPFMKKLLIFPTIIGLILISGCTTSNQASNNPVASEEISSSSTSTFFENRRIGYIHQAYDQNGKQMIDIDLAEGFFTDQDAGKAIREDNPDCAKDSLDATCQPPQGWYLRNKERTVSTLPVSNQVQILMETLDPYKQQPGTKISFEKFSQLLVDSKRNFKNIPFWVTLSNVTVVEIREQFIP